MTIRYIGYQYSNDDINWHDLFLVTDYYRRERVAEIADDGSTNNGPWTEGTLFVRDGYTPRLGVDYENGSFVSLVYKNADAKPIDPVGGSFDGTNEIVPTGWTISPDATTGTQVTWVSKTSYNMIAGNWVSDAWSTSVQFTGKSGRTPVKGTDYFDGVDGSYITSIYHVSANKPANPTGGSFDGNPLNEVFPSGWTDDPNTPGINQYSWMSKNRYVKDPNTGIWSNSLWSSPARVSGTKGNTPQLGVDYFSPSGGKFTSYIFKVATVRPTKPTTGTFNGVDETMPAGWTNDPSNPSANTFIWMTSRIYTDSGIPFWIGSVWAEAVKFSGDDGYTPQRGVDYLDGENGVFTSYVFRNAAGVPPSPTGGTFNGTNEVIPTGWADDPTSPTAGNQTFVSKTKYRFTADGVSPGSGTWANDSWSVPSQFSGTPGPAPVPGVDYFPVDGSFVTFIYKSELKGTTPSTPSGGTYNGSTEVTPAGWTDAPSIPADGNVMWVTTNKYEHNGSVWTQVGNWASPTPWYDKPVEGVDYFTKDGSYVSFQFKNVALGTTPATPTGATYNGTTETASAGWTLDPVQTTGTTVTWVSKTTYRDDAPATPTSNWAKTGWSTPSKFYEKGSDGINGKRGSRHYYGITTGSSWSNAVANGVIVSAGDIKDHYDIVTLSRSAIGYSETRFWNATNNTWNVITEVIDGNLLVDGTILGTAISSATTIIAGSGSATAGMNGYDSGIYNGWRFWSGNNNPNSANFRVNSAGKLYAVNAEITGKITIGSTNTEVTDANFKNSNTTKANVGLGNVNNTSDATVIAAATAAAVAKDNLSLVTANAYADGIVTVEETRAILDATTKANEAEEAAKTAAAIDATAKANAAKAAAQVYALAKANLAEVTAKAYADGIVTAEEARAIADATAKANTAKTTAITTAALDAKSVAALEETNLLPIQYTNIEAVKPPAVSRGGASNAGFGWAANPLVGNPLGVGSLLLNNTPASGESYVYLGETSVDYNIDIAPLSKQIVSCYVLSGKANTVMQLYLRTSDGAHKGVSITTGPINTWQRVSAVIDLSSNSSKKAILRIDNDSFGAGRTLYVSRLMVETKPLGGTNDPSPFVEGTGGIVDKRAGTVGGWTIDSAYIWSGTKKTTNGYSTSGITLAKTGSIRAKNFRIDDDGNAFFKGSLEAASGTFAGTVYAQNIEGDVVDAAVKNTTSRTWNTGSPGQKVVLTFNVAAMPFKRFVTIFPLIIKPVSTAFGLMDFDLYKDGTLVDSAQVRTESGSDATTTVFSALIPANTASSFELRGSKGGASAVGYNMFAQPAVIHVFKQGSSIT